MMTMYEDSKNPVIDNNTLELIYFYIPEYLVFKETGFCLHPRYNVIKENYNKNDFTLELE